MNKTIKIFKTLFLLGIFLFSLNSYAQDCSQVSNKICEGFNKMSIEVKKCTSLDSFDSINFAGAMDSVDLSEIPDSCIDHLLTASDKSKIKKSMNGFLDTTVNKMVELFNGMASYSFVNSQFQPIREAMMEAVDKSDTLRELAENLESLNLK